LHFIRARSNLILSYSSEVIPYIYSLFSGKVEGEKGRIQRERKEGRVVRTVIVVIFFLRLTNQSIFDNRKNGLPYFTYVVAVISV